MRDTGAVWPSVLDATRDRGPDRYTPPTEDAHAAIRAAVRDLVAYGEAARASAVLTATRAGFELVAAPGLASTVLLREIGSQRRGGGAYLIDLARPAPAIAVQAPHTLYEAGTLDLACELFERAGAAALFIDTVHRYDAAPSDGHLAHPADNAHNVGTLFQAATLGLLDAHPAATVVQLHGFSERGPTTTAILSSGDPDPGDALVARAAEALARVIDGVLRYPEDTRDLGATRNVQGTIVRGAGGRFLHVELQGALRKKLEADPSLRARLLGALAGALRAAG
jgi:hypothetical protein